MYDLHPYFLADNKQEVLTPNQLKALIERTKHDRAEDDCSAQRSGIFVFPNDLDSNQLGYKYTYTSPVSGNISMASIIRTNDSAWLLWSKGHLDQECINTDNAGYRWEHEKINIKLNDWSTFEDLISKTYLFDMRSTYNYHCNGGRLKLEFAQKIKSEEGLRQYYYNPPYKNVEIRCPDNTDIANACKFLAELTEDPDFWSPPLR